MTKSELIELLKPYPGDIKILVDGYEDGFDDVNSFQEIEVELLEGKSTYNGKYVKSINGEQSFVLSRLDSIDD